MKCVNSPWRSAKVAVAGSTDGAGVAAGSSRNGATISVGKSRARATALTVVELTYSPRSNLPTLVVATAANFAKSG